ncbi:MAG: sirohydrochlorin cobaltochelatase [Oscillospiraceae bacterium]|jgi:sirohydrochlorin cobaltochelatase|nr:sirohydrochlorin cobaltochelatase [Oscillospiraceae bacterium]
MKIKKMLSLLLSAALLMTPLAACGTGTSSTSGSGTESGVESSTAPDHSQDAEGVDTGDASLDDPRNQDEIGEKELLVVSFGTSYNDNRRLTIGAIETALAEAFPDWSVRRAFTSQIIIDRVRERDGVEIDNVKAALDRAVNNGVKTLVVQPTHLMDGLEYADLVDELAQYSDAFEHVAVGAPLLTSEGDFQAVAEAITQATAQYDDGDTAICFMGHGTEAESNRIYGEMQQVLTAGGYNHYYVGTVEAEPTLDDVLAGVKDSGVHKVVLQPLMIVAGDHANNDMAGDEEDSWKCSFQNAGYEVQCVLKGLGELEAIQQLFAAHAQAAMDTLEK